MTGPLFYLLAAISVLSGAMVVTRRNPIYSAVSLLVCFVSIAVLFLGLSATFLAAIHVLVYTGAILVLFLFVIMLLNLKEHELGEEHPTTVRLGVAGLSVALFALISWPVFQDERLWREVPEPAATIVGGQAHTYGSVETVGWLLFTQYGLAFELVSLLIIVAMFGAMVLAKKRLWT